MFRRTRALLAATTGAALVVVAAAPAAVAQTGTGATSDVVLRVELDGSLTVTETLTVPDGDHLEREVPLRTDVGGDRERVLTVDPVGTEGPARAGADGRTFTVSADPGTSTVRYRVLGAVAETGSGEEVGWQVAGAGTATGQVRVGVQVPAQTSSVSCLAGSPDSATSCTSASSGTETGAGVSMLQDRLAAGERAAVTVVLPAGTVPATASYVETFSLGRAFRPGTVSTTTALLVLLVLLGGAAALVRVRGRDAPAPADAPVLPVLVTDGGTRFASPDGVLPGQVGTVVDERVDPVDVTATVLDLAVRGHLLVRVVPDPAAGAAPGSATGTDFELAGTGADPAGLRPYERAVLALVADRTVSSLPVLDGLDEVRDALYDEVVEQGWFARRPDRTRGRWSAVAVVVLGAGVVATVVLAALTTLGLVGLALLVGGAVLLGAAQAAPARTSRGTALVRGLSGLRRFLEEGDLTGVPEHDREEVLSRSLPYAAVLDRLGPWTTTMSRVDSTADGVPGWSWLRAGTSDARELVGLTARLCAALDSALARADRLRVLR